MAGITTTPSETSTKLQAWNTSSPNYLSIYLNIPPCKREPWAGLELSIFPESSCSPDWLNIASWWPHDDLMMTSSLIVRPPVHNACCPGSSHCSLVHPWHRGSRVPGCTSRPVKFKMLTQLDPPGTADHSLGPGGHWDDQRGDRPGWTRHGGLQVGCYKVL